MEAKAKKEEIARTEKETRELLSELYLIQKKVKDISKSRSHLNDMMLTSDGDAQALAHSVAGWEKRLSDQRGQITRRLSILYRWNSPNLLPFVFSSTSADEFERNMRFLKIFTERDFQAITEYEKTLAATHAEKSKLRSKIRNLLALRKLVEDEERKISAAFERKSQLLNRLKAQRENDLKGLKKLREANPELDSLLQAGFFEKRGRLQPPVIGRLKTRYGTYLDKTYQYRLLNKGWTFHVSGSPVHVVSGGQVVFAGKLPGFGSTVVVDHGDQYFTVYADLNEINLKPGDIVSDDQVIGRAESRFYFEIRHFSEAIDPAQWIKDPDKRVSQVFPYAEKISLNDSEEQK